MLKRENLDSRIKFHTTHIPTVVPADLQDLFDQGYQSDKVLKSIQKAIRDSKPRHAQITLAECTEKEGRLYLRDRLYVPDHDELKAELLRRYHESPIAGHPGRAHTYNLLSRSYF